MNSYYELKDIWYKIKGLRSSLVKLTHSLKHITTDMLVVD